ncbi:hypothetical protein KVP40.0315 [Vibrio phage KVP40]|uniref:Uncharacterized protein n=1 Tax=Vibrio phage KVP40 (isolate Vibrio parahaemolyticus/Japan/Matsuzaki/1991) TaxID=75320 RepID=Q6WHI8_BPKVM|nr:hypothetical protein KVP40.0315 [Vibrio phage KVP40]AAQ64385.1 hypothetical protein KVP40.0315 [Vibrio phage KVP40]
MRPQVYFYVILLDYVCGDHSCFAHGFARYTNSERRKSLRKIISECVFECVMETL